MVGCVISTGPAMGNHAPPPPPFCVAKKKGKPREKITIFKAEIIERLSSGSKCYCFSHSRVSRIQKIFLSANNTGRQYFSVFQGTSTLKSISLALFKIPDPTIHDPTMHNSCINYPNKLKLYRENYGTGKLNFAG